MLRPILFLAGTDLRYMLKQRETLLWTFVMPVIFMFFFGLMGGPGSSSDRPTALALVNEGPAGGPLLDELVARLELENFRVDRVVEPPDGPGSKSATAGADDSGRKRLTLEVAKRYRRRLTVPAPAAGHANFTAAVLAGEETVLRLRRIGSGNSRGHDRFRVQKAVYSLLAELAAIRARRQDPDSAVFEELRGAPRNIRLTVRSAGKRRDIPSGQAQSIPGTMVMFTLMIMLTGGAITLVIEREKGLLRRLASAPMTRGQIVAGKWLGKLSLGVVQLAFAIAVSVVVFGMEWGPRKAMVAVVLVSWAMFCTSLGFVLGNLARSEGQMSGIGVITSLSLAALGGCWWPIEITPEWMQSLGRALPTGWAMTAVHKLVSFHDDGSAVVPQLISMWIATFALGLLARRTFRYQ